MTASQNIWNRCSKVLVAPDCFRRSSENEYQSYSGEPVGFEGGFELPQRLAGAKARIHLAAFSARLKSCPDTFCDSE
jgi:hypothetical protein